MNRPIVTCTCCEGSGKMKLQPDLFRTLNRLSELGEAIREELHEAGLTSSAINNRLTSLEAIGLVERAGKRGRAIVWKLTERKETKE